MAIKCPLLRPLPGQSVLRQRVDVSKSRPSRDIMIRSERPGWRGFVKIVCLKTGSPLQGGAKPDSPTTPHFSAKNNSSPKTRKDENRLALQPDFQAHGTRSGGRFACGYRDSARKGKRRGVLLVKCGRACQRVEGLRSYTLWE